MSELPLSALSAALGVGAALQIPFLLLRRSMRGLLDKVRYQIWVVGVAGVAFHAFARSDFDRVPAFRVFAFVAVAMSIELAYRTLDRVWLGRMVDSRGRHVVPQLVRDLLVWIVVAGAIVGAGTWAFPAWNLGTWALPSAVISAVLGFALQDVLKNVFAGLALQTETPFEIGDWLLVDNDPRQVLEMSWRSTHLRNNLSLDFREPNANLANAQIINLGSGRMPMGFEVEVGVTLDSPPADVKASLERAARTSIHVVADPKPIGLVMGFDQSGVAYRLRFWTKDVHCVARVLDDVRSLVWYRLQRDGFTIPYPVRTIEYAPIRELRADRATRDLERARALLDGSDLFGGLPEEARERLAAAAKRVYFDERERLVAEGEPGDSMMLIVSGTVSVSKSGTEIGAGTVSLATLSKGAYFGEMSLLTGAPRSATVTATEPVESFVLDHDAVAPILASDPALVETLSRVLAERTAATQARFDHRKEELSRLVDTDRQSIMTRIRGFFGIKGH
jgi:small-conductance mechanosensitive channel/CRP-like cAMP-binding protein